MGIILTVVRFNKLNILKIKIFGEVMLFLGIALTFVVNTNVLGEFKNDNFVVEEYLKDIDMRIDKLGLGINSSHKLGDSRSAVAEIYDLKKQVEYSNKQVQTANIISGLISFVGAASILVGKLGEVKMELDRKR